MKKLERIFVLLISLSLLFAPIFSAVGSQRQENCGAGVFQKIESEGGNELSDEKLEEKKGEFWGAAATVGLGAAFGGGSYATTYALGYHGWDWGNFAGATIAGGLGGAGGLFGSALGAGTRIGSAIGGAIGGGIGGVAGAVTNCFISDWF